MDLSNQIGTVHGALQYNSNSTWSLPIQQQQYMELSNPIAIVHGSFSPVATVHGSVQSNSNSTWICPIQYHQYLDLQSSPIASVYVSARFASMQLYVHYTVTQVQYQVDLANPILTCHGYSQSRSCTWSTPSST